MLISSRLAAPALVNLGCHMHQSATVRTLPARIGSLFYLVLLALIALPLAGQSASVGPISGRVTSWGSIVLPSFSATTRFERITAAGNNTWAFASNGTLFVWGDNRFGQTSVPTNLSGIAALSAANHCLALMSNGTVFAWGYNGYGACNVPTNLQAVAIAAGDFHSMALKGDVLWWHGRTITMASPTFHPVSPT